MRYLNFYRLLSFFKSDKRSPVQNSVERISTSDMMCWHRMFSPKIQQLFIISLVSVFLGGCSGYQYVASPRYVPLNEKKGDLNCNIYHIGAQVGYAFSNKLSAFATAFKRFPTDFEKEKWIVDEYNRNGESREINLGLTYFWHKENLFYEILSGGGVGDMEFSSRTNEEFGPGGYSLNMEADKWNAFIQPNFSVKINQRLDKYLAVAAFAKFNYVHYYNIAVTRQKYDTILLDWRPEPVHDLTPHPMYDDGLVYFSNHSRSDLFFIEPGIFVKAGGPYLKVTSQISYVINASGPSMHYQPLSINVGCSINFNLFDFRKAFREKLADLKRR